MEKESMELYLHIPFCVKKCDYCDFLSFLAGEEIRSRYVEQLKKEIEKMGEQYGTRPISTVFVGGGTPSALKSEQIVGIFDCLRRNFSLEDGAEISMEANPGTVTREKLLDYRRAGINRLSFGLQSADNRELKALGRIHSWETFLESYRLARECGFTNINIDLMSALPGQTVESWLDTLKRVTDLEPEHISAYSLIIEEGTPFFDRYGDGEQKASGNTDGKKAGKAGAPGISGDMGTDEKTVLPDLPDEDAEREMYHRTKEFLASAGYDRYEISNYARPGRECRHNIGYWTGVPYLGLGLGASSYMDGVRFSGLRTMEEYLTAFPGSTCGRQVLTLQDMQEEFFFVGLRMVKGVCLREFEERFQVSAQQVYPGLIPRLVQEGVAVVEDGWLRLTDYGLDVSNYVMAEFLQD